MLEPYVVRPIGFARSPFLEKAEAPRQAVAAEGVGGRIELLPEYEHALEDLEGFERIWVIFWFHQVKSRDSRDTSSPSGGPLRGSLRDDGRTPSKVLPPRSDRKRGLFATRSPHRPNPIGISAVRLDRVEGCVVHIRDLDFIDGTPVLDLKPYVPYADAFPEAKAGWLDAQADPRPAWQVTFTDLAAAQLAWLEDEGLELALRQRITDALALGPQPHAYRRIKKAEDGSFVLAVKEWRARFVLVGSALAVQSIATGYRVGELASGTDPKLAVHRAFVSRFG